MYIEQAPAIIFPKKRPLLKSILHGDEYYHARERELNAGLGKRGWQLHLLNWKGEIFKRLFCENESDVIELFTEIHTPGFDPRVYNIDQEIAHVLLFITQALTSGAGAQQNFTVPVTWGTVSTISCIGGGGNSSDATRGSSILVGAGGGGGGALASISNLRNLVRNGTTPYLIGAHTQQTWFQAITTVLADNGTDGGAPPTLPINGKGGLASNCVGTIKHNGGDGGQDVTASVFSSNVAPGSGGGSAASPNADGNVGIQGTANGAGGNGAASATVAGGTGSITSTGNNGNTGTDFDASHGAGSGGGGGGGVTTPTAFSGGTGGLYGAGAGGGAASGNNGNNFAFGSGVNGSQGLIFLLWQPYRYTEVYSTS